MTLQIGLQRAASLITDLKHHVCDSDVERNDQKVSALISRPFSPREDGD